MQRRLREDKEQLQSAGSSNAVVATGKDNPQAVGPTVYMPVEIGGVIVEVMVDTGLQSIII